ncbi:MAG TPA: glycosyltransferase [Ktedonobacteraceae bacterium]|jgi:cellulose synthase/poly-beta-1,6-N-acetylglucosamine synthase-like glycosyltransferase
MVQNTLLTSNKLSIHDDPIIAKKVQHYTEWLAKDAARNRVANNPKRIGKYEYIATQSTFVKGQEIVTFAPFRENLSAFQTTTPKQRFTLWAIFAIYVLSLVFYGITGLEVILALANAFYVIDLFIYFLISLRIFDQSNEEQVDDAVIHMLAHADWPTYTILCPLYREAAVVPQFAKAMKALDYPVEKLQILFLTEKDDTLTREAINTLHLPSHFKVITVPDGQPRTKPRACNYGLLGARGSYLVIFDAEDIPDPLQLKKAVLAFANAGPNTACVQAKLNFYNADQNMLTRWFTAEYSSWFDMTLPGLQMLNVPLPLGGTSNHFRTDILRAAGAWDPFNVTEDCDLGLRLGLHGMKTVVLDSTTLEEANSQYKNWMRQRSRWIKGYMQTYLVYMRNPLQYFRKGRIREFLSLQFIIGGKAAVLLINPLMWILLIVYMLFHTFVSGVYHTLYPMPVLYMGTLCLIFGNILYIYTHLIGCMKRGHYKLVKSTLLIPIYWAMATGAAYIALYQLIFKPHYWEKTLHGQHLVAQITPQTKRTLAQEFAIPPLGVPIRSER